MYLCASSSVLQPSVSDKTTQKRLIRRHCGDARSHCYVRPSYTSSTLRDAHHRMRLLRNVPHACAAMSFPGRLFLICLLLDTFYLACVYESAVLPSRMGGDNASESVNSSSSESSGESQLSSPSLSSSSSSSSPGKHTSAHPPASVLASSSSSSSDSAPKPSQPSLPKPGSPRASSKSPKSGKSSPLFSALSSRVPTERTNNRLHRNSSLVLQNRDNNSNKNRNTTTNDTNNTNAYSNGNNNSEGMNLIYTDMIDSSYSNLTTNGTDSERNKTKNASSSTSGVSSHQANPGEVVREFPMALVVASSTAAVSILLFFCLSYLWHTKQLDRRAQKLAIRLAAEVDGELNNCSQCRSARAESAGRNGGNGYVHHPSCSQDSASESEAEAEAEAEVESPGLPPLEELNSLREEDEDDQVFADGSRRKPGGVGRTLGNRRGSRSRIRRSGSSRSSRKWSGHSGNQPNRNSLVTDQDILTHFSSRRHSTFFI